MWGENMSGKDKPITIKGEKTLLSIFISENRLTFTVSRRTETGFERIDRYVIPLDYFLFKLFEKNPRNFDSICSLIERLEKTEDSQEYPNIGE
jgi:hypothetical protein